MRVYAVTFPNDKLMKEYKLRIEEAKKRDHRVLGQTQELFMFNALSPGSCFFLPMGAKIYNNLINFIKEKYWEYEYEEVVTPNIYNFELWKTSGHAAHYKAWVYKHSTDITFPPPPQRVCIRVYLEGRSALISALKLVINDPPARRTCLRSTWRRR